MGRTKALVEVDGTAMALRVARALAAAGCEPVEVIGDPTELAPLAGGDDGLRIVPDARPGRLGPLAGIETALLVAGTAGWVVVAACDLPDLTADAVGRVLRARTETFDDGALPEVVVARSDRLEPLCSCWAAATVTAVSAALDRDERAVHRVVSDLRCREVAVDRAELRNLNRADEVGRSSSA